MSVPYVAPIDRPFARDAGRPGSDRDGVQPYRRPVTPARRRRRTAFALAGRFALAAAIVATPVVAGVWLLRLPRLGLAAIEVEGLGRVERGYVDRTLASVRGQNLLLLDLAAVQASLLRHPWVAGVEVAKEMPNRLRVKVTEKQPVALLARGGGLEYLDAAGDSIAPVDRAHGTANLLLIADPSGDASTRRAALALAGEVSRANAEWGAELVQIDVLGDDDYRLTTKALPFPVLVRAGQVAARVSDLVPLLPELLRRYGAIQSVDLRFDRRIIVQPVAVDPAELPATPTPPADLSPLATSD
jgi:cell division septal protein FtsQ